MNAADARLTNECIVAGLNPEGADAPPSVRHAVAQLIQKSSHPENETNGLIENMTRSERTELARKAMTCSPKTGPFERRICSL